MKKSLFLLAALAFATAGTSFAQTAAVKATGTDAKQTAHHYGKGQKGPKDPAKMADHKAGKMAKELGLNADQEAKVESLLLARQQESTALKTKYAADKKAGHAEMKAAHDRYETQLKAILTPEQYAKMDKLKAEHHGHGKMKDGGKMKMKAKA
jgi:protein CpxP